VTLSASLRLDSLRSLGSALAAKRPNCTRGERCRSPRRAPQQETRGGVRRIAMNLGRLSRDRARGARDPGKFRRDPAKVVRGPRKLRRDLSEGCTGTSQASARPERRLHGDLASFGATERRLRGTLATLRRDRAKVARGPRKLRRDRAKVAPDSRLPPTRAPPLTLQSSTLAPHVSCWGALRGERHRSPRVQLGLFAARAEPSERSESRRSEALRVTRVSKRKPTARLDACREAEVLSANPGAAPSGSFLASALVRGRFRDRAPM
jgi:hypothetical protein